MNRLITLLSTLLLLSLHTLHAQTVRCVKEGGTGDGSSWSNASGDLQGIIDASGSGDEVWVAKGTYKPTVDFFNDPNPADPRFKSFKMRNGVGIYGGFRGVITETQRIQRNWKNNVTILSGDIGTPNDNSDNSYSVILNQVNLDNTARLDGFTITDGNANGIYSITTRGGGANNSDCSPLYANCIFTGNSASSGGAGMVNQNASTILINCSFINNNCNNGNGGGMTNFSSSSPKLINCSFAGNTGLDGGAIENQTQASAILTNCIIWGNTSGVLNTEATATITYSIVQDGYDGTGNLNTDPLFVDAKNGNLRLQSTSPAINTGNDAANTTDKDLDAYARKVGRIDIGAYEYQGPATPPSISVQPAAMQSACLGNTPPTLKVVATGDGLKYQWYSNSINTNIGGTAINAANTGSYIPPITTLGTRYYYVIVSGDNPNPATSDISAVTVNTSTSRLYVNASATKHNYCFTLYS